MEKRRRNLRILLWLASLFFTIGGILNIVFINLGYYQPIPTNLLGDRLITLLFVAIPIFGICLFIFCLEIVEKIEDRSEKPSTLEILLYFGGRLLVLIGIVNLLFFSSGYYQELSLLSPVWYFTIMVFSLGSVWFGIVISYANVMISNWITEFFKKRKKQQV